MSYTTFDYQSLQLPQEVSTTDEGISLAFEVRNTGKMAADEIAQVYISPGDDDLPIRPIQLQGFARISLQPGETKTVKMKLYTEQLGFYSHSDSDASQGNTKQQRQWNVRPGKYVVKVGSSSTDIRLQQEIVLKGESLRKPLRTYYFSEVE